LKLASLFAKYLYQHKELKLPGIGVFTIDPSIPVPELQDKNFGDYLQHIHYQQKPVIAADEAFINFIRTETGKIKPLAESDLDSFLSDGKILLNIGKPFQFEGIGYLQKMKDGMYEFTAGEPGLQKMETVVNENHEQPIKNRPYFSEDSVQGNNLRKILIAGGAIAGIILVVWLGYSLYHRNTKTGIASEDTITAVNPDSSKANKILDSVQRMIDTEAARVKSSSIAQAGYYKFTIERTPNKLRALKRYNQLREVRGLKMESKDSALFSLYFLLPAQPADTARIRDSLKTWYGRKVVYVE
jgi:hypothetical protein